MRESPTLLDEAGLKLVSGDSEFLLHPAHVDADHAFADNYAFAEDDNNADVMMPVMPTLSC